MITFQVEQLHDCLEEMKPLFPKHWEELGVFKDKMPLAPQYGEYLKREAEGKVVNVTARKDGQIISYYVAFIAPGLHYGNTLSTTMDIKYVHPDYRDRGLLLKVMLHVEKELRRRGSQVWYTGSKVSSAFHPSVMKIWDHMGFKPVDMYAAKWLGD